jgi:hypothetical protein
MDLFTILIVLAVVATAAFVFCIWLAVWLMTLVVRCVAMVGRAIWYLGVESKPASPQFGSLVARRPARVLTRRCRNSQCNAGLPGAARFCTRCGMSTNVILRQVA